MSSSSTSHVQQQQQQTPPSLPAEQKTARIYVDGACTNNHIQDVSQRRAGFGIYVDSARTPSSGDSFTPSESDVDRTLPAKNCYFASEKLPPHADYAPTNNRAELLAVVRAMELLLGGQLAVADGERVTIVNDSKYVHQAATDWLPRLWRANNYRKASGEQVENVDLVLRLDGLLKRVERENRFQIEWARVNSHQKEPADKTSARWRDWFGNDRADRLANLASGKNQFVEKKRKGTEKGGRNEKKAKTK